MNVFWQFLAQFGASLRPWVVVNPWEQVLLVRLGNRTRLLLAGVHWKIPGVDKIYRQSIRRRFSAVPTQTLMTRDGKVVTISGSFGYSIADIETLYNTLHHAEATLESEIQGVITDYVIRTDYADIAPDSLQAFVTENLSMERYGIADPEFILATLICVPTFRLLMGEPKDWTPGEFLNTQRAEGDPIE